MVRREEGEGFVPGNDEDLYWLETVKDRYLRNKKKSQSDGADVGTFRFVSNQRHLKYVYLRIK